MGGILVFPVILENQSNLAIERAFFALWLIALIVKLGLSAVLPLSADEAYYWVWSKNLALSYYDHPPMIAWLLALGSPLEDWGHAVRWPLVVIAHFVPFIWFQILKLLKNENRFPVYLLLFYCCPLTGLGGLIATPDLPLLLFWSCAVWSILSFLREPRDRWIWLFGASLGLGFCSKYQIVLLPLGLSLALFMPEIRKKLSWRFFVITFFVGLLTSLPVLIWNSRHEWVSFLFQLSHGLEANHFAWQWPAEYVLGQIFLIFPTILWVAWKVHRRGLLERVLFFSAAGPLIFFFWSSFRAPTELNWPIMSYPALLLLASLAANRKQWLSAVAFWGLLQASIPVMLFYPQHFPLHEKVSELWRFRNIRQLPSQYSPLYASSYQMSSLLWYASKIPVAKVKGMNRIDMYDFWSFSEPDGSFFLLKEPRHRLPARYREWQSRFVESPAPGLELWEVRPK